MKNKVLKTIVALTAMASMIGRTALVAQADEAVTLVFAEENSEDSLSGKVAKYFKEQVETLTDGSVTIDLMCGKVLGTETDILTGMMMGQDAVDIERVTSSRLSQYGITKAPLLGLPYTFDSRDQFWAMAESEIGQEILDELSNIGVTGLSFYEEGFRSFFFRSEVSDFAGISGKKIRVSEDQIMIDYVNSLGAAATPIASSELYQSLSNGTVDGAEQPLSPYETNSFYEVAPYVLLNEHTLGNAIYVLSDDAKNKLSEDQLAAVKEAAVATQKYNQEISAQSDEECMKSLEEKGTTFIPVEDKTPFKEAISGVIEKNTKGVEDVYQAILDLA